MEEDFHKKLNKLFPLYEAVKSAIILAENFDEKREMPVAPMNQLRSALDHIFKAVSANQDRDCDYELKEAEEHMTRAGYDALELLAGNVGADIIVKLQPYDTETLTTVFPAYFRHIKPKITAIRLSIANRRMERKDDVDKSFLAYFGEIKELISINADVDKIIPSLQEYNNKKEKEERNKRFWQYVIGPILALIIAGLFAYLGWNKK